MIIEGIVLAVAAVARFVAGLFGGLSMPGWWDSLGGYVQDLFGYMAGLGGWIPFGHIGNAVAWVFLCIGIALVVRLVRIVASFLTAGGGSAA